MSLSNITKKAFQTRHLTTWKVLSLSLAILLLLSWVNKAEAKKQLRLRGYAESRYTFLLGIDMGSLCEGDLKGALQSACSSHILLNRLRPSARISFSKNAKMRVTVDAITSHFRQERELKGIEDILSLERFYLELRSKHINVRIGKQSFQWGPAQLFNLTIPFTPQDPTDFNAALPGLWAISAVIGYGQAGGFKLGVLSSPDFKATVEFLRWNDTFVETEVSLVVMRDGIKKRITLGADVKAQFGIGFWLETALYIPYEKKSKEEVSFGVIAGIDYSFPVMEGLVFAFQYYYNHAGITDPKKYPFRSSEGLQKLAQSFQNQSSNTGTGFSSGGFLGAHYLLLTGRLSVTEDFSVSLTTIMNAIDPSLIFGSFFSWIFIEDFTLTLGAYLFAGPEGSEFNIGRIKVPMSGFPKDGIKVSPTATLFTWVRYNF